MLCRIIVALDHLTHSAKLIYLARLEDASQAVSIYNEATSTLAALEAKMRLPVELPGAAKPSVEAGENPETDYAALKAGYMAKVEKAKEYIAAGDIFQVVLSHSFSRKLKEHPFCALPAAAAG